MGVGPLANYRGVSSRLYNTRIFAFILDGHWNQELILNIAPPQYVDAILSTHLQVANGVPDKPSWKLNPYLYSMESDQRKKGDSHLA